MRASTESKNLLWSLRWRRVVPYISRKANASYTRTVPCPGAGHSGRRRGRLLTLHSSEDFRELLFADVALVEGHASARHVAAALLRYWDRRDRVGRTLAEELAATAGIPDADVEAIGARVDALIGQAEGDAQLAVTRRGGLAHELHVAVSRKDAQVSRQLTQLGAGIRFELREVSKDRYLDFLPVGEGGMGIVYWAMDTELGRQVAFKVVRPPTEGLGAGVTPPAPFHMRAPNKGDRSRVAFEELKARFLQEAWVTGGMEHPGIVPVYEIGRTRGGVPYYTMRFVRGHRTFETALDEHRARGFDSRIELLEPFLRVCDALAYAHSRGVIHRDIKPTNIALGEYGEAVILDWGLAKLGAQPDVFASRWQEKISEFRDFASMKTMTSALGTPGYMSPEAAAGNLDQVGEASDVYSLGVILFELATGTRPFELKDFASYAAAVCGEDAPDASSVDANVPPALSAIVASALARDPARRPAGANKLATQLRAWQRDRALDAEVGGMLAEAETALDDAISLAPTEMAHRAERATMACQRALSRRPRDARAKELLAQAKALNETSIRARATQSHRAFVRRIALFGLVALAVLGTAVAYFMHQERNKAEDARATARAERDNAKKHRLRAEEAIGFITDELREQLEPEGRLDVLAQIGERARAHFESVPIERGSDASFTLRARALRQLGEVNLARGDLIAAREVFAEAARVCNVMRTRYPENSTATFEWHRATTNVARVDFAQGYPRRGVEQLRVVVQALNESRPAEVSDEEWAEARVRAKVAFAHALRGLPDVVRADKMATVAFQDADRWRATHLGDRLAETLAIEAGATAALMAHLRDDRERSDRLIDQAVLRARKLQSAHPGDKTVTARLAWTIGRKAWIARYTDRYADAVHLVESILPRVRALTSLRPSNQKWRGTLVGLLTTLGDAQAGPKVNYALGKDALVQAYAVCEQLHAKDPSHAGWIHMLITLCDRLAAIASAADPRDVASETRHRNQAQRFARALTVLEADNPRWRFLLVYTMQLALRLESDTAVIRQGHIDAREHCRYALKRIPGPRDVLDVWVQLSSAVCLEETRPSSRIDIATDSVEEILRAARSTIASPETQRHLGQLVCVLTPTLLAVGEPGRKEARRLEGVARAWLQKQLDEKGPSNEKWRKGVRAGLDFLDAIEWNPPDPTK